jgi:XTP/dITP diphosphohydrolase
LEVDALGGAPGVWSSSFGGEEGNHARNNARLLAEMHGQAVRTARFRCTLVLARAGVVAADFSGVVEGHIAPAASGIGGFGYDPLFVPAGHDRSFAELGETVKNTLSHRARALALAVAWLATA